MTIQNITCFFLLIFFTFPIRFMYGIFTYSWLIFMVNVGKHTIHGSFEFNRKSETMLKRCRYQDVVAGQFFGHEHRFLPATHFGSGGFGHI